MQGKNLLLILLLVLAIVLGVGLVVQNNKATVQKQNDTAHITQLSNEVVRVNGQIQEQKNVNLTLENTLGQWQTNFQELQGEAQTLSNRLTVTEAALSSTKTDLVKTQAEVKAAEVEVAKRDAKIKELEGQNDDMTKKMGELNVSLGNLEKQISDTERKLSASEGDRAFLLKELKRLQTEKAELERQFNDLAVLREQVRKLKEELSISRRLDWIRRGIYGSQTTKGAELLTRPAKVAPPATNANLNVEIKQSGEVKIQSGTAAPVTNAPPK